MLSTIVLTRILLLSKILFLKETIDFLIITRNGCKPLRIKLMSDNSSSFPESRGLWVNVLTAEDSRHGQRELLGYRGGPPSISPLSPI